MNESNANGSERKRKRYSNTLSSDSEEEMENTGRSVKDNHFFEEEPLASSGMVQALTLAKKRGLLREKVIQAGRAKDTNLTLDVDPAPDISILHLDQFGRQMKPKEAFRELSHVFHGRGPGPVKLEKKLRRYREELKKSGSRTSRIATLERLKQKQRKSGQAYVLIDRDFARSEPDESRTMTMHNMRDGTESVPPTPTPSGYTSGKEKISFDIESGKISKQDVVLPN